MSTDRFTEIINYLGAISREVGSFRSETKARFESIETEMRSGFEQVRSDIRRLNHKFEVVVEDLTELKIENRDLRKRIEVIEKRVGIEDDL